MIPNTLKQQKFQISDKIKGILWKIFSCFCFAIINAIIHYLTGGSHITPKQEISFSTLAFYQNLFAVFYLIPSIAKNGFPPIKKKNFLIHALRIISAVSGVLLWYWSLKKMPIAQAIALSFTGPIFTILGAWLYLKESMSANRVLSVVICFLGAFIITRPDIVFQKASNTDYSWFWITLPLLSAIAIAFSKLFTRKLASQGDSTHSLTTYLLIFMVPVSFIPAAYDWTSVHFDQFGWLIVMGGLSLGAHYGYIKATSYADITALNPYGFSKFFFGTTIGFFIFKELPKSDLFWVGSALIILSVIILEKKKTASKQHKN